MVNKEIPPVGAYSIVGDSVVFSTTPNEGDLVELTRDTQLDRETNFKSYDNSFRPETINFDLDKIWLVLQESNLVDAKILARLKQEIEWRRTHDFNYDELAQVREKQLFDALKGYTDTLNAGTHPNIFQGVVAGVVFTRDGKSIQTHLEEILNDLELKRLEINEKAKKTYVDEQLDLKADQETTYNKDEVDSALSTKASQKTTYTKAEVDTKFAAYVGGRKGFTTLELAQAAQSTLPANTVVDVTNDPDPAKNGTYQWNGTTLTKSAYDPLAQAKEYTDTYALDLSESVQNLQFNIERNILSKKLIPKVAFDGVGAYASSGAVVATSPTADWRHTAKYKLLAGDSVTLESFIGLANYVAIIVFDLNGTSVISTVRAITANTALTTYNYTATQDCFVAFQHSNPSNIQDLDVNALIDLSESKKLFADDEDIQNTLESAKAYFDANAGATIRSLNPDAFDKVGAYATAGNVNTDPALGFDQWRNTGRIEVRKGQKVSLSTCVAKSNYIAAIAFDNSNVPRQFFRSDSNDDVVKTYNFTVENDGTIAFVSSRSDALGSSVVISEPKFMPYSSEIGKMQNDARFKGKTLLVAGDSITVQRSYSAVLWHDHLKSWFDLAEVKNEAVSGSGLIKNGGMCYRLSSWQANYGNPDLLLIMGNMNDGTSTATGAWDWIYGVGDVHKDDFTTVPTLALAAQSHWMALRYLFETIISMYPNMPFGYIISTPRSQEAVKTGNPRAGYGVKCWGVDGWFEEWSQVIIKIAGHYSIPVLDLYHNSNFRPWNSTKNETMYVNDGIHPNLKGHEVMAQKIAEFMKQFV
ncbi:SGNH/GDSL hydrolase family protein [Acinetobacter cumulans]|nr:SGNH/GDSL hydrolase family protein [Acinetobacter cumulans]